MGEAVSPEKIVAAAKAAQCAGISYTYTEPTIYFELAYDTARLAVDAGLKNVFVTNGYITPEALEVIRPYLHAANIDLKGFTEDCTVEVRYKKEFQDIVGDYFHLLLFYERAGEQGIYCLRCQAKRCCSFPGKFHQVRGPGDCAGPHGFMDPPEICSPLVYLPVCLPASPWFIPCGKKVPDTVYPPESLYGLHRHKRVVIDRQVSRHGYRITGKERAFVRHEKRDRSRRVARCVEHLHLSRLGLTGPDAIPVHEFMIKVHRSTDKHCEPRHRPLTVLEFHVLDPCPFGRVRSDAAAGCFPDCPDRSDMIRMRVGQDDKGNL